MLKLKRLQKERGSNGCNFNGNATPPSLLRVKRDLQEYQEIPNVSFVYREETPLVVNLTIRPKEGYYNGGKFEFECKIPEDYPNSAPEFTCLNKIYHPNIDLEGHVCLNILRSDWKPTLTLQLVFAGILHLFLQPNPNDPLNKDAANNLAKYPEDFQRLVYNSMSGGTIKGESFDRVF